MARSEQNSTSLFKKAWIWFICQSQTNGYTWKISLQPLRFLLDARKYCYKRWSWLSWSETKLASPELWLYYILAGGLNVGKTNKSWVWRADGRRYVSILRVLTILPNAALYPRVIPGNSSAFRWRRTVVWENSRAKDCSREIERAKNLEWIPSLD